MKVLLFGWEFPPHNSGGLGVACKGLSYALLKKGVEIYFVLPKKIPLEEESLSFIFADTTEKIQFHSVQSSITSPYEISMQYSSQVKMSYALQYDSQYFRDLVDEVLAYGEHARKIALKQDFDVIHAHDWLSFKAGIVAQEVSGKPFIAHIHATEFDRSGDHPHPVIYQIEKEGFEKADKIIAVSQYTKQIVVNRYGIHPDKIVVAHNGVDISDIEHEEVSKADILQASKAAGYNIILFLGRLTYQKNPEILLHAALDILKYHPKTLFVYGGSGDMERGLMEKAAAMGISDKVIFAGFVRGNDKHKLFRIADVFIMPSISEPFGIVPLEALANNTPVIVSKQSGIAEILFNSLKVDFWDVDEITNKIVAILQHQSLKTTLALNGSQEIPHITWDKTADVVMGVYRDESGEE